MSPELAPSILAADFARLGDQVASVAPFAGRIHADVMDGHYVPNLSMGPAVIESLRAATTLPIEVHLMVTQPDAFIEPFVKAGADRLIFHIEVVPEPAVMSEKIRSYGLSPGVAIDPATDWRQAADHLELVDLVTVMTVNPGFGGQAFIEEMLPKIQAIRTFLDEGSLPVEIEVDGGIDPATAARCKEAGANVFVAGNSVFGSRDPAGAARALLTKIEEE